MISLDINKAYMELQAKTKVQIEHETALTWAARAVAAHQLGNDHDAMLYAHEALEHASEVGGALVDELRTTLDGWGVP